MKASEQLKEEHTHIVGILDCLDRMAEEFRKTNKLNSEEATSILDFIRNFADKYHHGKEEVHFFPMMEKRGFSRDGGPTGVMIYEHEEGRGFVRNMFEAVEKNSVRDFIVNANAYSSLLRQHIEKEDHCLFSMADEAFTENDQIELEKLFKNSNENELKGLRIKYLEVSEKLHERFGIPSADENAMRHQCACE